jgi:hypothetical protein
MARPSVLVTHRFHQPGKALKITVPTPKEQISLVYHTIQTSQRPEPRRAASPRFQRLALTSQREEEYIFPVSAPSRFVFV